MKLLPPLRRWLAAPLGLLATGVAATPSIEPRPECSPQNFEVCLNGVSSPVTNGPMMRESLNSHGETSRGRSGTQRAGATAWRAGREAWFAAGDPQSANVGAWASYNYVDASSDFATAGATLGFESDAHNALAGADRLFFGDRLLLGLSGGYTALSADTTHNGGGEENDGYSVVPYAALLLTDIFSIDASGGYTALDYDQNRVSPTDGTLTTSTFDADRWFIAGNVNATLARGNWIGNLRLGAAHANERQDAYAEVGSAASALGGTLRSVREREIHLTQLVVGGEIAYGGPTVEPYVMVAYHNDLDREDDPGAGGMPGTFRVVQPSDDDEVQIGLGLRCYAERGITATLEYLRVEGREDFDLDSLMATLRLAL
jgi:hypothetical protein